MGRCNCNTECQLGFTVPTVVKYLRMYKGRVAVWEKGDTLPPIEVKY